MVDSIRAAGAAAPEGLAGARCAVHPVVQAATLCERCGSYACLDCTAPSEEADLCATCARRFAGGRYGSFVAIGAGILGFLGLGCAPAGPAAVLLAAIDLFRIATRRSPKGGVALDVMGLLLGVVGTILWAYLLYQMATEPEAGPDDPYGPYSY